MKWYEQASPSIRALLIGYAKLLQGEVERIRNPGMQTFVTLDSAPPATWRELDPWSKPWVAMAYLRLREELGLADEPPKE